MISERLFARSFTSFWKNLLPFSEVFVRGVNSRWDPLGHDGPHTDSVDRAIANEGAVRLFRELSQGKTGASATALAIAETAKWMGFDTYEPPSWLHPELEEMTRTLVWRYGTVGLLFEPEFVGCGIVNSCAGDFLAGSTLVEVKSGHRGFRSADFRQVLTYLALNYARPIHSIEDVSLYNARLNRLVALSVDNLCLQMGAESPPEVFSSILEFLDGGVVSDF